MKTSLLTFLTIGTAVNFVWASTVVSYTASGAASGSPDANSQTVDVWTQFTSGAGFQGSFYPGDSSTNGGSGAGTPGQSAAGAGTSAWGLYAGGDPNSSVTLQHFLVGGSMTVGQTMMLDFDNGYVGNGSDGNTSQIGIKLFGTGFNFVTEMVFNEGSSTYSYGEDSGGGFIGGSTGVNYTDSGFTYNFTLTTATTYFASITQGATTLGSWSGATDVAPAIIEVFNRNAEGGPFPNQNGGGNSDLFINNLQIVPEPNSFALIAAGAGILVARRRRRTN